MARKRKPASKYVGANDMLYGLKGIDRDAKPGEITGLQCRFTPIASICSDEYRLSRYCPLQIDGHGR